MTYTKNNLINLHSNNLNNIQSIISRLSNIGYALITINISIVSIILPLAYTLNINNLIRCLLLISLLIIQCSLFFSSVINLKNERVWRLIYNEKTKIDLDDIKEKNIYKEILYLDFKKYKKINKIEIIKSFLCSFLSAIWIPLLLLNAISIWIIFII